MSTYRQLLATAGLILISFVTSAQEYTFKMDTVLKTVRNPTYGRLRMVDARTQKDNIGDLKTGAFNRNRPLVTEKPLPELLGEYYDRMITGNKNDNAEILLVLYNFELIDRSNGGEIGTFYFDGDFYGGIDGKYSLLATVDSIYEVNSSWDVTQTLLKQSKVKIHQLLSRYANQQLPKGNEFTQQQAVDRRQHFKEKLPIYNTGEFKKGVYFTAEQFINNTPVDTPIIKSVIHPTGGKKQVYFYYPNKKGKKGQQLKKDAYFAIYDGKEWSVPSHFFAETMRCQDGEFYANLPFRGISDKAQAMATGYFIGGVIGAVVATSLDKGVTWGVYRAKFNPETKTFVPQKRLN